MRYSLLAAALAVAMGSTSFSASAADNRDQTIAELKAQLEALTANEPATAAHLMTSIAQRLSERLRHSDEKVRLYSHLVRTMQQEIDALMR